MNVTLLYRAPGRFSIEHVFETIGSELVKMGISIEEVRLPEFRINVYSIIKNIMYARKNCSNITHVTGAVHYILMGLGGRNTVLTIHDFRLAHEKNVLKRIIYNLFWHYIPLKKAKAVTCISQFTKNEICAKYPWAEEKIEVIHNPIDPAFKKYKKVFNQDCPVILHIGTNKNKNLERVIVALSGIKCQLRIIGKLNDFYENLLTEHNINYTNAMNLSSSQIVDEYNNCDVISFPSLYEGFGMPIIEGQAVGRPVVCSNIDVLREIGNDAVIYVQPDDIESIRNGFSSAIYNSEERNSIIEKGFKNVQRFYPSVIADKYYKIYKRIGNY